MGFSGQSDTNDSWYRGEIYYKLREQPSNLQSVMGYLCSIWSEGRPVSNAIFASIGRYRTDGFLCISMKELINGLSLGDKASIIKFMNGFNPKTLTLEDDINGALIFKESKFYDYRMYEELINSPEIKVKQIMS